MSQRHERLPLVIAVVIGLAASAVVYFVMRDDAQQPVSQPTNCVSLEISSSTEKNKVLAGLAAKYNSSDRLFNGKCATVSVHGLTSGAAKDALAAGWDQNAQQAPPPQVWTPSTSLWLGRLAHAKGPDLTGIPYPSIMTSPLVVAMPEPMAQAFQAAFPNPGWKDMLTLATAPDGWGSLGHPEWGKFAMGRDNPHLSSSGLTATIATYHAAALANGQPNITESGVDRPEIVRFVHDVESSVARYGDDAAEFVETLYAEDEKKEPIPYISGIVFQEQLAYLYNSGVPDGDPTKLGGGGKAPNTKLTTIYPKDGTVVFDHPYITLPGASPDQVDAAKDFHQFLFEREQREALRAAGFRDGAATTPTDQLIKTLGVRPDQKLTPIATPSTALLEKMVSGWNSARRKARVMLVLDVSGSMEEPADKNQINGPTKLALLKPAALKGIDMLSDNDEVALWTFSSPGHTEVVPMSKVSAVRERLKTEIQNLKTSGNTALYETTAAAHQKMQSTLSATHINAVVLLTDGKNTSKTGPDKAALIAAVDATRLDNSVRIFTIPYGADAERDTLNEIAVASKAVSYDEAKDNPLSIDKVFVRVFSNF